MDDEGLFRDLLTRALSADRRIEVVDTARNGAEAIRLAEELEPDVVLMDIELGGKPDGIEAGHRIKASRPETGMVLLSQHKDRQYISSLPVDAASGWSYLLKQSLSDVASLQRAIEGAAAGMVLIDAAVLEGLRPRSDSRTALLTQLQLEILELMAQGVSDKGIVETVGLDDSSLDVQVELILERLEIDKTASIHPRVRAVLTFLEETQAA